MSFLYKSAIDAAWQGGIDLLGDNLKIQCVESGYAPASSTGDDNLDDIPSGDRVAGGLSGNLASKTLNGGVFDAADLTISSVPAGPNIHALVLFQDTGSEATSRLIAYLDSANYTLEVTPDGNDVVIVWPSSGILKLRNT
jgi:hypothetical protein